MQSRQEAGQEPPCKAAAKQAEPALLSTDATHQLREVRPQGERKAILLLFCLLSYFLFGVILGTTSLLS